MVDDGSTDGSRALAERFACRDRRFRLVTQPNGGLGSARNTGDALAGGEFLAFADSDDVVPPDAYERLLGALDATGSDFATGNVQRLTRQGAAQAQFLARTFARTRLRTHVSRCRPLLADRTAWNKLWRRSFWDAHAFRFPEGVVHEDIPVTLPAHVSARSVDVLSAPVYQWRLREDGAPSITQRRLEHRVLADRLRGGRVGHRVPRRARHRDAVALVRGEPRRRRPAAAPRPARRGRRRLPGDCSWRARTRCSTARRGRIFAALPAIERLKWRLVRRGPAGRADRGAALPEARGRRRAARATPRPLLRRLPVPHGPGGGAAALGLPARPPRRGPRADRASWRRSGRDGDKLRLRGRAAINGLGAASGTGQRTTLAALRPGRLAPAAAAAGGRAAADRAGAPARPAARPRLVGLRGRARPGRAAAARAAGRPGTWDAATPSTRVGLLRRRRGRFVLASPELIGAVDLPGGGDACVRARGDGRRRAARRGADPLGAAAARRRVDGGVLELAGDAALRTASRRRSSCAAAATAARTAYAVDRRRAAAFRARVPLADVRDAPAVARGRRGRRARARTSCGSCRSAASRCGCPTSSGAIAWTAGGHDVALIRTRTGDAASRSAGSSRRRRARRAARAAARQRALAPRLPAGQPGGAHVVDHVLARRRLDRDDALRRRARRRRARVNTSHSRACAACAAMPSKSVSRPVPELVGVEVLELHARPVGQRDRGDGRAPHSGSSQSSALAKL